MPAAKQGNDFIDLYLNASCFRNLILQEKRIHLQEKLRHRTVGTADSAGRAHRSTADKLLIRPVKHDKIFSAECLEYLDILHRHRTVLHCNYLRILLHLQE